MDPVSQTLLGAVSSQVGFRQKIGKGATWWAALAAASPDLDIFFGQPMRAAMDSGTYWARVLGHRGISHSLLAMPLWVLPIAVLWWGLRKLRRRAFHGAGSPAEPGANDAHQNDVGFGWLYLCVLVAGLTHPLLDWCTSYGTQILSPLTTRRYALDCVAIVDPICTALMAFVLVVCWLSRRRSPQLEPGRSLKLGVAGLMLIVAYMGAGRLLHDRAIDRAIAGLPSGTQVVRADAYPMIGSLLLWRAVIETPDGYYAVRVHHLSGAPPAALPRSFAPRSDDPWIERARTLPAVENYAWFADGRVRAEHTVEQTNPHGTVHRIAFHDLRYGLSPESLESHWALEVILDENGRLLSAQRGHPFAARDESQSRVDRRTRMLRDAWRQQITP